MDYKATDLAGFPMCYGGEAGGGPGYGEGAAADRSGPGFGRFFRDAGAGGEPAGGRYPQSDRRCRGIGSPGGGPFSRDVNDYRTRLEAKMAEVLQNTANLRGPAAHRGGYFC